MARPRGLFRPSLGYTPAGPASLTLRCSNLLPANLSNRIIDRGSNPEHSMHFKLNHLLWLMSEWRAREDSNL